MVRLLPLLWVASGVATTLAFNRPQDWAFIALCIGGAAIWCEVQR